MRLHLFVSSGKQPLRLVQPCVSIRDARSLLRWTLLTLVSLTAIGCEQSADRTGITEVGTDRSTPQLNENVALSDGQVEFGKLKVGDTAPDFEIEAMGGEPLTLSSFFGQADRPTVLLFNRAHW